MINVIFFDILLILILFGWCYARIIQKDILNTSKIEGKNFAKLTIITGAFLVLILLPYVKFTSLNLMLGIFLVSILWIFEQFPKFIAIKKEEVSRLSTFSHFKYLFAGALTILILGETATINTILGGTLMILGGIFISMEKRFYKKKHFSNLSMALFVLSMLASGIAYFWRQFLLEFIDPFSIMFFSTIFSAILILPSFKNIPKISKPNKFIVSQILMAGGFFLLLWILSQQELVLTVPILAFQPLIILLMGKFMLKESKITFKGRFFGIIVVILGYLILRGFLF